MIIHSVFDKKFKYYGQITERYDFSGLIELLGTTTPKPANAVIYIPSDAAMEALPIAEELKIRGFGGLPIQIGYCNGTNSRLNCLEYHRNSEINIAADDIILLLACQSDLENYTMDTSSVEAFLVPAGTGIELYATTLHYAPCSASPNAGFRVVVVLPLGTNLAKPEGMSRAGEDRLCTASNKWLIAHPGSDEAKSGAFIGLTGENIDLYN